ncbi:putative transmembrane protein pft27 protein [Phialemonium atrogriseum]|uniref:Transmembrane protein pft27 protein n=1 Tax=Phialemonium atrogriseum TaxID=1093897 RepID=A0AAJ0BSA6_9PEZI|nr:putative transmembrane protein pft27 protein [Phialemonium atrogriseum]KAK1763583.1 putative transmembrane protein pft27 protein [Phialemonium atrogriseum]
MRLRHQRSPLLLLLIPSLAASAALASSSPDVGSDTDATAATAYESTGAFGPSHVKKHEVGTKDAPVDGKDGRPHEGPFVEIENLRKNDGGDPNRDLPVIKDRPTDPTMIDGKRIPDSNDGVMDDKNRPEPKIGTTGTSGGVSEKDKARKEREGKSGGRMENRPDPPKEAPPLPHSEQEKITLGDKEAKKDKSKEKSKPDGKLSDDVRGLEKPIDLPDRTDDKSPPLPNSANKDHLDVSDNSKSSGKSGAGDDANDGLLHPLHSFFLSLTMILFSEIGDKTFLVAALMAMKHDRMVVFSAALSALIAMTALSAIVGHAVPTLIPQRLTNLMASALFFVFGARLLREGMAMSPDEGVSAEMQEVEMELEEKENLARKQGRRRSSISPYSLEMGLGSRKSRSKSRFPTPPRSPSTSPDRSPSPRRRTIYGFLGGLNNLLSLLLSPAWVQTFVMTFLGEWGDRSQIATFAMAAGQDYWVVTLGAILGHACCTSVAVIGGRAIAGRVSLKVVTMGGAVAFLVFGVIYLVHVFYS